MNNELQEELIKQLSKYNKKELYQWLIVSMIHPSNQIFGIRYELLIYTLLAIEENEFLNKPLKRKNIEHLVMWFQKNYTYQFKIVEDWESFKQTKLIPILLDGKKYYFFYGEAERPYEVLKQLHEILFTINIPQLIDIKKEFFYSLEAQTSILKVLMNDKECKTEYKSMYTPSIKFFKKFKSFFLLKGINTKYLHIANTAYNMHINNFNGLYTQIEKEYYFLPFQNHIEVFYTLLEKFIYSEKFHQLDIVNENMVSRLSKIVFQFFDYRQILLGLIDIFKENRTEFFDVVSRVDANKIILFKFIPHKSNSIESIDSVVKQSIDVVDEIKNNHELIGLRHLNEDIDKVGIVPADILEFTTIIIYERISLNYMLDLDKDWKIDNIFIYNSLHIKPIFELLDEKDSDSRVAFLEYLNAEKELSRSCKVIKADVLDSFSYYYNNKESFPVMGNQPNLINFVPHEWSSFYNEYLYKKYQDNIYELVESKYPNKFNAINKHGSTYTIMDTSILDCGRCIKYQNKLICLVYPNLLSLQKKEVKVVTFLGEFIAFYFDKYKEKLFKFLSSYSFDINKQDIIISLYPNKYASHIKELEQIFPTLNKLLETKEIVFFSEFNNNTIHTLVLFKGDIEYLEKSFELKNSINTEKEVFKELIHSLLLSLKIEEANTLAQDFINTNCMIKENVFVLQAEYTNNPKLQHYREPHKFQDSFIGKVNQEMVVYLKNLKIEQKEYWGEEAKELNNLIFEFLQQRLEEEISKLNNSSLTYAYTEIEYIEGKRESNDIQMNLDSKKYIEFNIHETYNKDRMEVSELIISAKHIIHTILKVNPKGYKAIVDDDWYYLMAFSKIINETIQISDHLHYNLSEEGIEITEQYELKDIEKSYAINTKGYYQEITSSKILSSKNTPLKKSLDKKNHIPKKVPIVDIQLNETWKKEYGFYIDDMLSIMTNLSIFDVSKTQNHISPLSELSMEKICNRIQNTLIEPPSNEEIKKAINFISLDFSTYQNYKCIDYSMDRLMKKKDRLNLSPFIKIENKYLFGHQQLLIASKAWVYPLRAGDIPFAIDDKSLIKKELIRIHRKLDLELEELAYNMAKDCIGKQYVEKNILNFRRLSTTFQKQPPCGEIDLLIANPKRKVLFVMDAKNINKKFFVSAISQELRNFFKDRSKKKSYLSKLNMKVDFVKDNQDEILNHFKITDKNGWKIKKGFVVNTLYVSAFYKEKVDFILVDDLERYINNV